MATHDPAKNAHVSAGTACAGADLPDRRAARSVETGDRRTPVLDRSWGRPMPTDFDLIVTADDANRTAEFRLLDASGVQVAYRQTDFKSVSASNLQGPFDLRDYLRPSIHPDKQPAAVAQVGVCIAEQVLG